MAFESKQLNNVAGSTGYVNLWLYDHNGDTKADIKGSNYFLDACNEYGMKSSDVLIVRCSDARYMCVVFYNGTTATTAALSTF